MLRVILFDVEHGFCAFIKTPTGRTILIDCGKAANFSPVKYIREHELAGTLSFNGHQLTKLIITHPHEDHIEDIRAVMTDFPPAILQRWEFNWDYIKTGNADAGCYECLDAYSTWQATYNAPVAAPDFGLQLEVFALSPAQAQAISGSKNSTVNNSSIVVVVKYVGTQYFCKFIFAGDMEQVGWTELLKQPAFRTAITDVTFNYAAHHGHSSGFSTDLFNTMGKPALNLVSVTSCDESHDDRYSSDEFSEGWTVAGEQRKVLTTRSDGAIFVDCADTGWPTVFTARLPENIPGRKYLGLGHLALGSPPNRPR